MGRRDEGEFVAFAEACRPALRRTAYFMCGDWGRAADITQEALIRVYVAWPRLEQDHGLRAYARRAVMSVAIEQARKRSITCPAGSSTARSPRSAVGTSPDERLRDCSMATLITARRA